MAQTSLRKEEHFVASTDQVVLQVKEIYYTDKINQNSAPILLVHGGGPDAITSFDLVSPFPSFAEELAARGLHVFLLNIRGWGKSSLPNYNFSDTSLRIGNVREASDDIQSVLQWLTSRYAVSKVNLFGWATGGHWIAYSAIKDPKWINRIILLNTLYSAKGDWPLHKFYASPENDSLYNKTSPFRETEKEDLTTSWTNTIPVKDKSSWRMPVIETAYKNQACAYGTDPNLFKVPGAFQEESFYMALGKKYWNAKDITVPTMMIRSEFDFWSREIDLNAFEKDFPKNIYSQFETINGTHYLFLDRNDKGKDNLLNLISQFVIN